MIYHYCRVSTKEQNLDRQLNALSTYKPADRVFTDKQSGKNFDRPAYQEMKRCVVAGDEVIIKELDRLGRNKDAMKQEIKWFGDHGVTLRILNVPTTLMEFGDQEWVRDMVNTIIIEVLATVAQEEREKNRARQAEGIAAMKIVNGKRVSNRDGAAYGRPAVTLNQFPEFPALYDAWVKGTETVANACKRLGMCKSTWYKLAKEMT